MRIIITNVSFLFLFTGCGDKNDPNSITASGTIEAINVIVSSKTAGQILRIIVKEGDMVKAGDVLVEIDHELLDIQLRQAEAGVDLALAQLRLLQSGARREDIKQAEEVVKQAKVNLDLAQEDKNRTEQMFKEGAVTEKQYDDAVARYRVALTQYNSASENLRKVKTIVRPQEIESAQANVKSANARVDQLKKNIEDCIVKAPVDGFVSNKFVEAGENAGPGSSLLKISSLGEVELVIYVSETELGKVKLRQKAEVTVDAFKDKAFIGEVIYISPEAEFTPKNIQTPEERTKLVFAVKIQIPNPQYELKPGMPADARIVISNE
jgi:HlyD family secretion protein